MNSLNSLNSINVTESMEPNLKSVSTTRTWWFSSKELDCQLPLLCCSERRNL